MDNRHNNHTSDNVSKEQIIRGAFPNPGDQSLLSHASLDPLPAASLQPVAQASPTSEPVPTGVSTEFICPGVRPKLPLRPRGNEGYTTLEEA
jgi:hypothetical protein